MRLAPLDPTDSATLAKLATLSHRAAARDFPKWLPTLKHAHDQLRDCSTPDHITRVLFDTTDEPLGWISCHHAYGDVYEIHPLLISIDHHQQGHGARLLSDIEAIATTRGAGVLIVSTADETNATSLGGRDLYDDPLGALASMTADPTHPVGFWMRMGYVLVGVTPDAEGPGQPTIHLAKQVRRG